MSKIHLAQANILTGLPLAGKEEPQCHPEHDDVRVFHVNAEKWLELNGNSVGDVFAFYKATDYDEHFHDRSLPYGTHCIRGLYTMIHYGYIVVTTTGWEWIRDEAGEIFTGLPNLLKNHHPS